MLKHYLRVYCFKKQDDWATLLLIVEFMYHQMKHSLLSCSFFKVMYNYKSIFDIHIKNDAMKEEVSAAKECVEMLQDVQNTLTQWWQNAINAQTKYYNQKHKFKFFNVNNLVMLSAKNLKQKKLSKKLWNKMIEFFHIQEFINKQMYHLDLSIIYRVHSVFHVFLLKLYNCRLNDDFIFNYLVLKLIDNEKEWKIEKILQKRKRKKILYYKIQWKEYFIEYDQWILSEDMKNVSKLIEAFEMRLKHERKA